MQRDAFGGNPARPNSLNRYGYSAGNPIVNTDPNGHWLQILAGAGLGALISYGGQVAGNLRDGGLSTQAFTDVDWRQVGEGAVAGGVGAATFGVGTAVMGSGVLGGMGASAISGVAAGQASKAFANVVSRECLTSGLGSLDDIVFDAVAGAGGGVLGRGISFAASKATRWGPYTGPGPLASDIAETFRSATYSERTLSKAATLYRVIGPMGDPYREFWTADRPSGPSQAIVDLALDQTWGNPATRLVEATVPRGTTIYEGYAASQRGLVGGGSQVYIPRVDPNWVTAITDWPW